MARIKTFYDELGVARNATSAEIKRAFKETAKVFHPDKNPSDKQAWAHEQMSRFNFIFETLMNPSSRKEYDEIVRKYEEAPPAPRSPRSHRAEREENAIAREYALVSVEIMNLSGKYLNCRIKMGIGASVGSIGAIIHLMGYFTKLVEPFPMVFFFSYFFALMGGVMLVMGIADHFGRGQYKRRIDELEERRSVLRRRMFEAYV
jgi:curved DNA-binding protein CbpA